VPTLPPACSASLAAAAMPTPVVAEHQKLCNSKLAFTILEVPQGATYEPQKAGYTCTEAQMLNGQRLISCTGPDLTSFNLKVCSPAPTAIATVSGNQCTAGTTFDSANQCCMPAPAADAGCRLFQVDLKSCSQ